jgi:hypothetical protein
MNDVTLIAADKWLTELGIRTVAQQTSLLVNRDDIISLGYIPTAEGSAYDMFLNELRSGVNSKRLYWADKDNQWLHLKCF